MLCDHLLARMGIGKGRVLPTQKLTHLSEVRLSKIGTVATFTHKPLEKNVIAPLKISLPTFLYVAVLRSVC